MSNMQNKEQQILEGNKLIAEFLGFKFHKKLDIDFSDCGGIYDRTDVWSKVEILSEDYPESDQFYISDEWKPAIGDVMYGELKYHENWSELMPVVEKIELEGYVVNIKGISVSISKILEEEALFQLVCGDLSKKIELVFSVIVEFIKWYKHIK